MVAVVKGVALPTAGTPVSERWDRRIIQIVKEAFQTVKEKVVWAWDVIWIRAKEAFHGLLARVGKTRDKIVPTSDPTALRKPTIRHKDLMVLLKMAKDLSQKAQEKEKWEVVVSAELDLSPMQYQRPRIPYSEGLRSLRSFLNQFYPHQRRICHKRGVVFMSHPVHNPPSGQSTPRSSSPLLGNWEELIGSQVFSPEIHAAERASLETRARKAEAAFAESQEKLQQVEKEKAQIIERAQRAETIIVQQSKQIAQQNERIDQQSEQIAHQDERMLSLEKKIAKLQEKIEDGPMAKLAAIHTTLREGIQIAILAVGKFCGCIDPGCKTYN